MCLFNIIVENVTLKDSLFNSAVFLTSFRSAKSAKLLTLILGKSILTAIPSSSLSPDTFSKHRMRIPTLIDTVKSGRAKLLAASANCLEMWRINSVSQKIKTVFCRRCTGLFRTFDINLLKSLIYCMRQMTHP